MGLFVFVSALILASAYGETPHYPINDNVARILPIANRFVYDNAFDEVVLPDLGVKESPVFIGTTLANLSTIVRAGDCEMWGSGDDLKVKLILGLADMKLRIYMVPMAHQYPMTWHMTGTKVELGVTLHTKEPPSYDLPSECNSTWDYIKIINLGDIFVRTMDTEYNNKSPPESIRKLVLDFYNEQLNGDKQFSIKKLDNKIDLCNLKVKK